MQTHYTNNTERVIIRAKWEELTVLCQIVQAYNEALDPTSRTVKIEADLLGALRTNRHESAERARHDP